jgi:hypothetical protein
MVHFAFSIQNCEVHQKFARDLNQGNFDPGAECTVTDGSVQGGGSTWSLPHCHGLGLKGYDVASIVVRVC